MNTKENNIQIPHRQQISHHQAIHCRLDYILIKRRCKSATDTRFNELSLWIDSNQDGVTDTGELKTLTEMGVTSLTLNSTTSYIPSSENTNTIIQETTFTRHSVLDTESEILNQVQDDEIGIMRDVLFRYENTSKPTDGVYFDMDGNGIQEKMTRWTDPNEWMIVKDINNDGQITSGKEVVGNHMTLPNGTKAADTIQALKTFDINNDGVIDASDNSGLAFWTDRNHNGVTDIGELEALGAAGAIQTPQGEKIIKTILFYEGYGMNDKTTLSTLQNYTLLLNINLFKQEILSQSLKKDIINNSFFIFNNLHVDMNEVA